MRGTLRRLHVGAPRMTTRSPQCGYRHGCTSGNGPVDIMSTHDLLNSAKSACLMAHSLTINTRHGSHKWTFPNFSHCVASPHRAHFIGLPFHLVCDGVMGCDAFSQFFLHEKMKWKITGNDPRIRHLKDLTHHTCQFDSFVNVP
jgi:hypothetical protein